MKTYESFSTSPVKINKAKTIQLTEERILEIEKHNRQLFAKMDKIDRKPLPKFLSLSQEREQIVQNICEGRIRFKSRQIDQVESENRKMLNRL